MTSKEDLSLWKYVRRCRTCKKEFGSDDPKLKQRCWHCTYLTKAKLLDSLAPKKLRKAIRKPVQRLKPSKVDKYDGIHLHVKKHGWTWGDRV